MKRVSMERYQMKGASRLMGYETYETYHHLLVIPAK